MEALAEPGGICISGTVHDHIGDRLELDFDDLGDQNLKNIARPIRVFRVRVADAPRTAASIKSTPPTLTLPDKPSIAVLPFQNMSGDPEQEYFVDGMVEEITTALSRIRWLFVIARNSSFTYKGQAIDVKRVGRDLGVRYVLEGSVRKAGNRVRITGELIDAATGTHLWADRFDGLLGEQSANRGKMVPLYTARIEDLGPGDLVKVECVCGHSELLTAQMLGTAGVKPFQNILDLQFKLRCRECDKRGRVVVSIRWAT